MIPITPKITMPWGLSFLCIPCATACADMILIVRERFSKAVESGALIWVSSVSMYELWYGVGKSVRAEANAQRLKVFLAGPVRVLEFGEEDARYAGEIRIALERAGKPIGAYDVLIAGQALRKELNLVTANAREFARVKDLRWEEWAKA